VKKDNGKSHSGLLRLLRNDTQKNRQQKEQQQLQRQQQIRGFFVSLRMTRVGGGWELEQARAKANTGISPLRHAMRPRDFGRDDEGRGGAEMVMNKEQRQPHSGLLRFAAE
jgi:hypothetical protein